MSVEWLKENMFYKMKTIQALAKGSQTNGFDSFSLLSQAAPGPIEVMKNLTKKWLPCPATWHDHYFKQKM